MLTVTNKLQISMLTKEREIRSSFTLKQNHIYCSVKPGSDFSQCDITSFTASIGLQLGVHIYINFERIHNEVLQNMYSTGSDVLGAHSN
jgi:hypothetical protein